MTGKDIILVFIVFGITLASSHSTCAEGPKQLRVLCYNIHHGRGTDNQVDLDRIAKVIRSANPDLVALQEVDKKTNRTGGVDQTTVLADRTQLFGKFVKQIDYDGGEYGQAILSKVAISKLDIIWLPGEPPREQRIVGVAELAIQGRPFRFCTTHLHHANAELRLRQAQEVNRAVAGTSDVLTIIAGDFNAEPSSEPIRELSHSWQFATSSDALNTFHAERPTKQIDYIAYRPQASAKFVSVEVVDEPTASDHRPILAILELDNGN